ncbi:uncharacterized protein LOC123307777 [Coccinella septempunctata]|uniref:uncharacterized protein LOC123307777 n=1 Tax=Coccinella septempunctata TaxID=41139 RepID=UPI001D07269D|nr:uncharacterized protein LOC123307777 [Coccinella septempunctata]
MKTITLVKIGAIGGFITCGMGFALQRKLNDNVKNTTFYKSALDIVRHNKAAVHYLGEPIKDKSIDTFNSKKNYVKNGIGQFEVRLRGSKQNGILHIFIKEDRVDGVEAWKLDHLELALDKDPDKILLIKT